VYKSVKARWKTLRKVVPIEQRFAGVELNARQREALHHVAERGRITRAEYETVTGATERTAKRDLNDMVKRRILIKKGGGNNYWYVLAGPQYGPEDRTEQAKE
jgi:predicted HTH transcriptional regulator